MDFFVIIYKLSRNYHEIIIILLLLIIIIIIKLSRSQHSLVSLAAVFSIVSVA